MNKDSVFTVGILGGYGKMGQWLARFLQKEGKEVLIAGRNRDKLLDVARKLNVKAVSSEEVVRRSSAVILSVSINSFEAVVKEIAPHTRAGQFIFDVTSIKARPVQIMHKYISKGTILGVHPMFGPGASGIKGQKFVLTPTNTEEQALAEKTRAYLEVREAKAVLMEPAEHDEIMSIVLGLSHFIALVSADTLAGLGKIKESGLVSGTTYRMLLKMAEAVVSEDPDFYSSLQQNLPDTVKLESLFTRKAGEWASLVNEGKRDEFIKKMRDLKDTLEKEDPEFNSAYHDMYRMLGE